MSQTSTCSQRKEEEERMKEEEKKKKEEEDKVRNKVILFSIKILDILLIYSENKTKVNSLSSYHIFSESIYIYNTKWTLMKLSSQLTKCLVVLLRYLLVSEIMNGGAPESFPAPVKLESYQRITFTVLM